METLQQDLSKVSSTSSSLSSSSSSSSSAALDASNLNMSHSLMSSAGSQSITIPTGAASTPTCSATASSTAAIQRNQVGLMDLPDELLLRIFCLLDDLELQSLFFLNRKLHRIVLDHLLRHQIFLNHSASLDYKLSPQRRLSPSTLLSFNILKAKPNAVAHPSYFDAVNRLERQTRARRLRSFFPRRPASHDLVERGVIPDNVSLTISPALAQRANDLSRHLTLGTLNRRLQDRPTYQNLAESNLVKGLNVSPCIRSNKLQLEKAFMKDKVRHMVNKRPAAEALIESHVLLDHGSYIPNMICPSIKPKVIFFEKNIF